MAINFKDIAQSELSLSQLMNGRFQIKTHDIVGKILTIEAFDFATITVNGEDKVFPVILFAELPDNYYNGGNLLSKLCARWAAEYDGDVEQASADLKASGGVRVRFKETKTKSGNNLTSVEVI